MGDLCARRHRGLSLIEVMIVMAILALSIGLVGPRIGAGMTGLEVRRTEDSIRGFVEMARSMARRTDRPHWVVLDRLGPRILLLDSEMQVARERMLPSSVDFIPAADGTLQSIYVPPSGLLRDRSVLVRTRLGTREVVFE